MCNHKIDNKKQIRHGAALEHGKAHEKDHAQWSRRSFLRNVGMAGTISMMLGKVPLTAMANSPLAYALSNTNSDRIMVLIRLKGGNDGLNTIIPLFDYSNYMANRPTIGIPQSQIINLNNEFGMPNYMSALEELWNDGAMKVVNSVGYPDQNLSHFRSSDIWASGSDADLLDTSGWLGRFLNDQYPDYITSPPDQPPAIQIGGTGNIIFNDTDSSNMGVIVNNPDELFQIAQNGELYDVNDVPDCYYGEQLTYMRAVANSTFQYAEVIAEAYNASTNAVEYEFSLGQQLALVARLIKGNLGTQLYMVTLDGFDTHALQNESHPFLLFQLANAVQNFYQDLATAGMADKVLAMTFSEFGRRIEQNASGGTDHGAAAPMMLFGKGLNGNGILGQNPDMQNLDSAGNLVHGTDFRQVYATVLENWLCADGATVDMVMGQNFDRLSNLGLDCLSTNTSNPFTKVPLQHKVIYGSGEIIIEYELANSGPVKVEIFNMLGQPVTTLINAYQGAGMHRATFSIGNSILAAGYYVYSIQAGQQRASQKVLVSR